MKLTPLTKAIRASIGASLLLSAAMPLMAQDTSEEAEIEEVLVTATKRSASTQDIAVAVSAITSEKLDQLGVSNFEDYLIQLHVGPCPRPFLAS